MEGLIAHTPGDRLITRDALATIPTPAPTATFQPIPHIDLVNSLIEALSFRHISVMHDQYAVSEGGMKLFGLLELETGFEGCRFNLGMRNANDKSMRLALTVGFRVLVCSNLAFYGDYTPVLHKHTKHFDLKDALAIGVDRMQRNFKPMVEQVERWRGTQISDDFARVTIYKAFVEGYVDAPRHMASAVHHAYFEPDFPEFIPRTTWALHNAFTGVFRALDPIPCFRATASLGRFFGEN